MRKNGMPGLPRRLRHGGGGGGGRDFELLRRIESMGLTHDHPDVVAEKLRAECKDYARIKLQPFAAQVHRVLQRHQQQQQQLQLRNQKNWQDQRSNRHRGFWNGLGDGAEHQNQKSLRPLYTSVASTKSERRDSPGEAGPPSSSPSHSGSSSSYSSEEKDAIFDAKVDPEVDLTKSMLRQRYSSKPKSTAKAASMEIENATDKPKRKLLETGDGSGVEETLVAAGERIAQGGAGEKDGPMFSDFGGIRLVLDELITEVLFPLCHPELPRVLGVRPMAGILLHGPPGCGKTRLAHAIANEAGVPFYKICATDIVSGISGESEGNVRDLFKKAYRTAPSIVFIDEIDAIASKRENMQKEMEKRIVTQLMTCMDESHQMLRGPDTDSDSETSAKKTSYVLVIGATNRPDAVEPALRRPGRFDKEIVLGVPDEYARKEILSVLTKKLRLDGTFDLFKIARSTPGYVGADLTALVNKAGNLAMKRIIDIRKTLLPGVDNEDDAGGKAWWKKPWTPDEVDSLSIKMDDFEEAVKLVQPSLRREGFSPVPDVRWDDVGGLHSLREEFERYVVRHIKNPDVFEEFGVTSETGFLLYGPPGCGKTLIAKAVAHEAGANFIHVKGPELLNKYVGESELAVRTLFSRARTCAPCILFFDEVDAITTKRGKEGGWVVERLLNQLLIELDGADKRHGVHVIGATNRPEVIDPAVKRPGRLGREMYVPLPTAEERGLILKASARKKPLAADVDLDTIGRSEACENFSGADLNEVVNKAATLALEDWLSNWSNSTTEMRVIKTCHFEQALKEVFPSVSEKDMKYYNDYRRKKGLRESPPSSLMKLSLMK